MLKKPFIGVLVVALLSTILIAGVNFNVTKAVSYGSSGTLVGGYISENATWTLEDSPYVFVDNVVVSEGATLTVEPGVAVDFTLWLMRVEGTLCARGSESNRIAFYWSEEPLDKYEPRIRFIDSSTPWNGIAKTGCILEYVGGKYWDGYCVDLLGGSVKVSNCVLSSVCTAGTVVNSTVGPASLLGNGSLLYNFIKGGITLSNIADSPTIIGNLIMDCNEGITFCGGWKGHPYIANNTITHTNCGFLFPAYVLFEGLEYMEVIHNNIYNNNYNVRVEREDPRVTINLAYNWWGTTNTTLVDKQIRDQRDNARLPLVAYTPFLTSPAEFFDIFPPEVSGTGRVPWGDVEPNQAVTMKVDVTDEPSGVDCVILSYTTDNGTSWSNSTMVYNSTTQSYETEIPGQPAGITVKFRIIAYDNAGNCKIKDYSLECFFYTVIPEFPSTMILPLFMLATLIATVLLKKKRKTKPRLP